MQLAAEQLLALIEDKAAQAGPSEELSAGQGLQLFERPDAGAVERVRDVEREAAALPRFNAAGNCGPQDLFETAQGGHADARQSQEILARAPGQILGRGEPRLAQGLGGLGGNAVPPPEGGDEIGGPAGRDGPAEEKLAGANGCRADPEEAEEVFPGGGPEASHGHPDLGEGHGGLGRNATPPPEGLGRGTAPRAPRPTEQLIEDLDGGPADSGNGEELALRLPFEIGEGAETGAREGESGARDEPGGHPEAGLGMDLAEMAEASRGSSSSSSGQTRM